jgi:undecaprenyl pyrophosphate phosphatase UppP
MNLELIVTIVLAMISSLIPTVYKRITDSANITNPYTIVAAVILGILSACVVYSLMTLGLLGTLYYFVVYIVILGSIFLTQYLVKLNSK